MEKTLEEQNKKYEIREEEALIEDKDKITIKFYFWEWNTPFYGWRQMGNMQGYDTLEELKKDNSFCIDGTKTVPPSRNWKILKAYVIEQKAI